MSAPAPSRRRALPLLPTSTVGSLPQPDWLIDRERLAARMPPRVRAAELWRVAPEHLDAAQDDAVVLALASQERAGLDVVTDGEVRRESYSNHLATALDGLDLDRPGTTTGRTGEVYAVPRVVGPLRRRGPVQAGEVAFVRARTDRAIKATVPGPFTLSQQAQDDHYRDPASLALAYAEVVREEVADLFAAGADVVQLDEPWLQVRPEAARAFGTRALARALEGAAGTTAVHVCFGYAALVHQRPSGYDVLGSLAGVAVDQVSVETAQSALDPAALRPLRDHVVALGVLDLSTPVVEAPAVVAARVRRALDVLDPARVVLSSDCGMKYLPRASAEGKMRSLVAAAALLRAELEG